jgi:hypothetical protein
MKIYFSGAKTQKKKYGVFYKKIVVFLERSGHQVFQDSISSCQHQTTIKKPLDRFHSYQQVLKWIKNSDAVFLEVSFPSTLRLGYEISLALDQAKPVVALYHQHSEPSFFLGLDHELLLWVDYNENTIVTNLQRSVRFIQENFQIRFNCKLSYSQHRHLEKASKKVFLTKSAYLRQLIQKDLEDKV